MLYNKSARKLIKKVSKTYNIHTLWQQNQKLGIISQPNSQIELEKPEALQLNDSISFIPLLSQILFGCLPFFSQQQPSKMNQMEV